MHPEEQDTPTGSGGDRPSTGGVLGGSTPQHDDRPSDDVPERDVTSTSSDPQASGALGEGSAPRSISERRGGPSQG
jgi:hypothetical protein